MGDAYGKKVEGKDGFVDDLLAKYDNYTLKSAKYRDNESWVTRHLPDVARRQVNRYNALSTQLAFERFEAYQHESKTSKFDEPAYQALGEACTILADVVDLASNLVGAAAAIFTVVSGGAFAVGLFTGGATAPLVATTTVLAAKCALWSIPLSLLNASLQETAGYYTVSQIKSGRYSDVESMERLKKANSSVWDCILSAFSFNKLFKQLDETPAKVAKAFESFEIARRLFFKIGDAGKYQAIWSRVTWIIEQVNNLVGFLKSLKEVWDKVMEVVQGAKNLGKKAWEGIKAGTKFVGEKIVEGVEKTKDFLESLPGRAKRGLTSLANWGRKALNSAADNAQEYFKDKSWLPAGLLGAIGGRILGPAVGGLVGGAIGGLTGGVIGLFAGGPVGALAGMGLGAHAGAGVGAAAGGVVGPAVGAMLASSAKAIPGDGELVGPFYPHKDSKYVLQMGPGLDQYIDRSSIIYVNGINTSFDEHCAAAQHLADASRQTVVGIYNGSGIETSGTAIGVVRDLLQCVSDKAGDIGRFIGRGNPAIRSLVSILKKKGDPRSPDGGLNIVAHSQGSIVVSEALRQARIEGANISGHNVTTFGNAAFTFPAGPKYVHNVHDDDLVSTTSGSTSVFSKLLNTRLSGLSWLFSGDNDDPRRHTRVTHSGKSGIDPHDVHGYIEEWKKNRENPQQAAPVGNVDVRRSAYASTYALARAIGSGVLSKSKSVLSASDRIMAKYAMPQDKMIYFGVTSPAMHGAGRLVESGGNWLSKQIDRSFTNWGPQRQGTGIYDPSNPDALRAMLVAQSGSGSSLSKDKRSELAPHLGFDPSHARLHSGPDAARAARALNAEAFTIGSDVFFGEGRYSPNTKEGLGLLAHELTHVGQQTGVFGKETRFYTQSGGDEMEREAQVVQQRVDAPSLDYGIKVGVLEVLYDHADVPDPEAIELAEEVRRRAFSLASAELACEATVLEHITLNMELDMEETVDHNARKLASLLVHNVKLAAATNIGVSTERTIAKQKVVNGSEQVGTRASTNSKQFHAASRATTVDPLATSWNAMQRAQVEDKLNKILCAESLLANYDPIVDVFSKTAMPSDRLGTEHPLGVYEQLTLLLQHEMRGVTPYADKINEYYEGLLDPTVPDNKIGVFECGLIIYGCKVPLKCEHTVLEHGKASGSALPVYIAPYLLVPELDVTAMLAEFVVASRFATSVTPVTSMLKYVDASLGPSGLEYGIGLKWNLRDFKNVDGSVFKVMPTKAAVGYGSDGMYVSAGNSVVEGKVTPSGASATFGGQSRFPGVELKWDENLRTFTVLLKQPKSGSQTKVQRRPISGGGEGTSDEKQADLVADGFLLGRLSPTHIVTLSENSRLRIAGLRAAEALPTEMKSVVLELISPESLKMIAGVGVAWGASHLVGIGQVADAAMLGLGAVFLGTEMFQIGEDLRSYYITAKNAETDEDLTRAGGHLASAVSRGSLDTILAFLSKGVKKGKTPKAKNVSGDYAYNMVENPGPLARIFPEQARTFAGGRYNAIRLESDLKVYRAGAADSGGQYFSRTKPISEMQVRRDFAVERTWNDPKSGAPTGLSQIEGYQEIVIPKGTVIYEGPAASRGGYFSGGNEQIFIPRQDVPTDPSRVKWIPWK